MTRASSDNQKAAETRTSAERRPRVVPSVRFERVFTTAGVHPYDEVDLGAPRRRADELEDRRDRLRAARRRVPRLLVGQRLHDRHHEVLPRRRRHRAARAQPAPAHRPRRAHLRPRRAREHGYFATEAGRRDLRARAHLDAAPPGVRVQLPGVVQRRHRRRPQQVSACFILVGRRHDGLDPQLVPRGGPDLQGRLRRRPQPVADPLEQGAAAPRAAPRPVRSRSCAAPTPRAGTIKSGGATRRAAKMVVLDVDHPDIEEFIETKVARGGARSASCATPASTWTSAARTSPRVQYQNANNSVRVSDEFMRAVEDGARVRPARPRDRRGHRDGRRARRCSGRCARPPGRAPTPASSTTTRSTTGTPTPRSGRITASNPCSEYMSLDNSSCNLASLNLLKFLKDDDTFDAAAVRARPSSSSSPRWTSRSASPTSRPRRSATPPATYRQLGIGYANLGALLMATGLRLRLRRRPGARRVDHHPDDRHGLQALGRAGRRRRPVRGLRPQRGRAHQRVMRKHAAATDSHAHALPRWTPTSLKLATQVVGGGPPDRRRRTAGATRRPRVLAPTGTIGFMMDCDTTGIEPDFSLVKFKKLVGGGSMQIVNQTIPRALRTPRLHRGDRRGDRRVHRRARPRHRRARPASPSTTRCSTARWASARSRPMGHVRMMAAVPAVPLRRDLQDGEHAGDRHRRGGRGDLLPGLEDGPQGARDLPRQLQGRPAAVRRQGQEGRRRRRDAAAVDVVEYRPVRKRLPKTRPSQTVSFTVGGAEGYMTAGSYPDDGLGEVFLKLGKQGSTLAGVMDAFSIAISIALQYGVPLEAYVNEVHQHALRAGRA